MPYRPAGRANWMVTSHWRGRRVRLSAASPIRATADRHEATLRALVAHDHADTLEAVLHGGLRLSQVTQWIEQDGIGRVPARFAAWSKQGRDDAKLWPHVEAWLAERRALGGAKPGTLDRYASCLRRLLPADLTASGLTRELVASGLAAGRNQRKGYVALRQLVAWLRRRGVLQHDPLADIPAPRPAKPRDRWLEPARVLELAAAAPEKYRVGILLSHAAGLEASVIVNLSPRDVDPVRGEVWARGTKTRFRERRVRIASYALDQVRELWERRQHEPTLLPPMSTWALSKAHRMAAKRIGESGGLELRSGRHSFSVRLLQAGTPLQVVADQLGHADTVLVSKVYGRYIAKGPELAFWESRAADLDRTAGRATAISPSRQEPV